MGLTEFKVFLLHRVLSSRLALSILGRLLRKRWVTLYVGENTFRAELADTPLKRAWGLMDRPPLNENEAMLFVFPKEGFYGFHVNRLTTR